MSNPLTAVMTKIDRLDGRVDKKYFSMDLRRTSAAVCKKQWPLVRKLRGRSRQIIVKITNSQGRQMRVDCAKLARRLNALTKIAQKLPSFTFMAKVHQGQKMYAHPKANALFAYLVVDTMITSFLNASVSANTSLRKLFSVVPFATISKQIRSRGATNNISTYSAMNITSAAKAYGIFRVLGAHHKFNAKQLKPTRRP